MTIPAYVVIGALVQWAQVDRKRNQLENCPSELEFQTLRNRYREYWPGPYRVLRIEILESETTQTTAPCPYALELETLEGKVLLQPLPPNLSRRGRTPERKPALLNGCWFDEHL